MFVAYGLAFTLQYILPLPRWRLLVALQRCTFCSGFWGGVGAWGLHWLGFGPAPGGVAGLIAWGFASAAFSFVLDRLR